MHLPAYLAPHVAEPTGHKANPFHRYRRPKHHLSRIRHPRNTSQQYAARRGAVLMRKGVADVKDRRKEPFFYGNYSKFPNSSNRKTIIGNGTNPRPYIVGRGLL